MVAVGGRQHTVEEATELIEAFLEEPFSNDERHVRRIGKIAIYENTGEIVACARLHVPEGHSIHRLARQFQDVFAGHVWRSPARKAVSPRARRF